jgi:hypothetical protein
MPKGVNPKKTFLEEWEVSLIKAMISVNVYNDQEILAYFTRPTRTLNHRLIGEIRKGKKHGSSKSASKSDVDAFLTSWPNLDPKTGLHYHGDELITKAREAMIAAVNTFNSAGLTFRSELYIVTAIIAWTYLCHAWLKRQSIAYIYKGQKTKADSEKYWELEKCLDSQKLPLQKAVVANLKALIEIRHEIEHRSTSRIDDTLFPFMQACCFNFNATIIDWFGAKFGVERTLPIALQLASFGGDQIESFKVKTNAPTNLAKFIESIDKTFGKETLDDPYFKMKIAILPVAANKTASSHMKIEIEKVTAGGLDEIGKPILFKEVQKKRHTESDVILRMHELGYKKFNPHSHRQLWRGLQAKSPEKGFGCKGDYRKSWVWFDNWIETVRQHCLKNEETFK